MTYFLKKKKWMAWVVLLTFLFTSFMPSNILAGNSVASAEEGSTDAQAEPVKVPVTIVVVNDDGTETVKGTSTIVAGTIADNLGTLKTALDGNYSYVNAKVDNDVITWVSCDENDKIYYKTSGEYVAAMELPQGSQVTLYYESFRATYTVTYKVDGEVDDSGRTGGKFTGMETVKAGNDLRFYFTVNNGKSLNNITVTVDGVESPVEFSTDGGYVVTIPRDATENGTITVEATTKAVESYDLTVSGSNTWFTNETGKEIYASQYGETYSILNCPSDGYTMKLHGYAQWSKNEKTLNKFVITEIGGEPCGVKCEIPTGSGKAETKLANGMIVTITRSNESTAGPTGKQVKSYWYTVTITGCYENIRIDTNFKDVGSTEAWVMQLDGVEPAYSDIKGSGSSGSNFYRMDDDNYISAGKNQTITYYLKAQEGYEFGEDAVVVIADGVTVSGTWSTLDTPKPVTIGGETYTFTHKFTINTGTSEDWRLYFKAIKKTYNYEVVYDVGNSTTSITDENTYDENAPIKVGSDDSSSTGRKGIYWLAGYKSRWYLSDIITWRCK